MSQRTLLCYAFPIKIFVTDTPDRTISSTYHDRELKPANDVFIFEYRAAALLTRAPLGYSAERAPLGGGADSAPLSNSRTDGRRKTEKTANESSQPDES